MNYQIDENGALRIFKDGEENPFVYQPTWPNGDAWEAGEAEAWGEALIESIQNPDAPSAGPSRETPTVARPDIVDVPLQNITPRQLDELVAAKVAEALAATA